MEVTLKRPHLHRDWIDPHGYGIVKALQKGGHTTYLVGGCVRDLLVGVHPKDYDIATSAHPPQVKKLIYMSFIIGKRFRLVLVKRDDQQFEVATFRREATAEDLANLEGPTGDNLFGTPEEDARRRDFTINGLFYDPIEDQLIDYVEGLPDIDARILRMIGDPAKRLLEDPIRMLRGVRLSHKLGFTIEPTLREAMKTHASELEKSVLPRRREEILKILRLDEPELTLTELADLNILKHVIPTLDNLLQDPVRHDSFFEHFNAYRDFVRDPSDTTQLFGWLTYSMLRAAQAGPSEREEPITIEDEIFQHLMREELGMYKFEQTALTKSVELLTSIVRTEDFKRRGERRQLGLMKNEGFKLALRLAEVDYLLTVEQSTFWRTAYAKLADEIQALEDEAKSKKRRRPRRPRRGEGEGGDREPRRKRVSSATDDGDNDLDDSADDDLDDDLDDDAKDSTSPRAGDDRSPKDDKPDSNVPIREER